MQLPELLAFDMPSIADSDRVRVRRPQVREPSRSIWARLLSRLLKQTMLVVLTLTTSLPALASMAALRASPSALDNPPR